MSARVSTRGGVAGIVAVALALTLVAVAPAQAASRGGEPTDTDRRAHSAQVEPQVPDVPLVPAVAVAARKVWQATALTPLPASVVWPDAATSTIEVTDGAGDGATPAASRSMVTAGRADGVAADSGPKALQVRVLDRSTTAKAGVQGILMQIDDGSAAPMSQVVDLAVDYSGFAAAYGGDWSSRLRLVSMPDCALSTPTVQACQVQTPLVSTNDASTSTVSAKVAAASLGVVALTASASGSTGNWAATSLSPSSSWQVSEQTGSFAWSYPLAVPAATGGPQPELALTYSSGSLDGKVAGTNTQASWVGDGWDLATGFVERSYVPCAQDAGAGTNNAAHLTGDLCWSSDNATIVFNGKSEQLVKDASTGAWRLRADDATKVEHLTGGWNDDNDGEYWKVTTADGTQYWFGRERRSSTDTADMESAWTVPVYGNAAGEPCYAATFAASACTQAWRWNLDYVVDTSGNSLTYTYVKETNSYGRNLNQAVSTYVRGGYLSRIDYGQRAGTETASAPDRVDFTVAERCLPTGNVTCDPAQLSASTASSWPDVPFDQICTSTTSCPDQSSPTFFTRKRLTGVTTRVFTGDAYQDVASWTLTHTFPAPGDATSPALWLASIQQTGKAGTAITLPAVQFTGTQLVNRVDTPTDGAPAMIRYRISSIRSETGAVTSIAYTPTDCSPTSLPASPDSNTRRCLPVQWDPEGPTAPITEYFHKYLVASVVANANDGASLPVETRYTYVGDPAWHYDQNTIAPPSQRTWNDFRGYGSVDVITGASGQTQSATRYRYFRGMDGDHLASGGTRSATVDAIADVDRLNGFLREQITYDGPGGPEVGATVSEPWISAATATAADGTTATFLGTARTDQRTATPALTGGVRTTRTLTTYDATYGTVSQVDDQGDVSTTSDDRCTRMEYARNTTANIIAAVQRTETVAVGCGAPTSRPQDVVSDVRALFDGGSYGAAPTRGLVTATQRVSGYVSGAPVYVTEATTAYDTQGRVTSNADALGRTTTTAYTPATGGPMTRTVVTGPDPDGAGAATALVTTTDLDPLLGVATKVTDPNGKVTTATYDALGRITAVWLPGRPQATKTANTTYAYTISGTGMSAVTTKTLTAAEAYLTSVTLYDGLLRTRQTQSTSLNKSTAGRLVTDTFYDSRGLVQSVNNSWFTTGDPGVTLVAPTEAVPSSTSYVYDGAGRTTATISRVAGAEVWRTTTAYRGDRVDVTPPSGGTPTTTISDARGRTSELRQYTGGTVSGPFQATTYAYDKAGNLTRTVDPAGNTWTSTYDVRGRLVASTDPDKGATSSTYDDAGQTITSTDARGVTLWYGYDALGRKIAERSTSATGTLRALWTYDTLAKGNLTSSTRYEAGSAYTTAVTGYDDGYRPLGAAVTIPAAEGVLAGTYTTNYTYTPDGQLKQVKLPAAGGLGAETVTTYYDTTNQPSWMSGGVGYGAYAAGSSYSSLGELTWLDLGTTYSFQTMYDYEYGTRRLVGTWSSREGIAGYDTDVTYTYDAAGNLTSSVDAGTAAGSGDRQCFAYDGLRRLTQAWTPASAACSTAPSVAGLGGSAPYWSSYGYDLVGNRTSLVAHTAAGDTTSASTYPAAGSAGAHQVSAVTQSGAGGSGSGSYGYDASGNTTTRQPVGSSAQSLTWDPSGRLASVSQGATQVGSYVYAADGSRLVRRQGTSTTVYLPGGMELTATGSTKSATRYYTFAGQVVATRSATGAAGVSILLNDPHGSATIAIANLSKAITVRRLDPFGNPRGTTPTSWPGDHGFLGKPTDTTGLTAVGARYLDPTLGRFISVDPVMDLADPQQWNAYSYANNNPTTYSDPTGLRPIGTYDRADTPTVVAQTQQPETSAPITIDPPVTRGPSIASRLRTGAHNALAETVNGSASALNAMVQNPGDTIGLGLGIMGTYFGASVAAGGGAVCITGVGCLAGAPAIVAGVALAGSSAALAGVSAASLASHATGDSRMEIMQRESISSSSSAESSELPELTSTRGQLEAKYKHATDFGVQEPRGGRGFEAFGQALRKFVSDPSTVRRTGTYRSEPAVLNYNESSRLIVVQSPDGSFVSGWRMSEAQWANVFEKGALGGG